jgi:dihydroxyacetone kinase-like predicted kinase
MKTEVFTAEIFKNCILAAEQRLLDNKEYLNFLDINFMADHDTGNNIYQLFKDLKNEINNIEIISMESICNAIIKITTNKPKGNSSIAIGLFLQKIAKEIIRYEKIECCELSEIIQKACNILPKAISNPKEKSILTITNSISYIMEETYIFAYLDDLFREILLYENIIIDKTKINNLYDAGAKGLIIIFEAFYISITNDIDLNEIN